MGFRDMKLFNQAMLGRQSWRILTVPNSLCAKVLKGRYFPHGDFWNAKQPRNSSYTWRSLMFGRELLKKGVIWRVGNGKKIQLIKDRWIQGLGVLKPVINLQADTTVSYLIDEAKGTWNENLVKECFNPSDAEQILQLSLCHNHCEDFPSWPYTKEGIYSVRSAYDLAKMEGFHKFLSINGKGESSDMTN